MRTSREVHATPGGAHSTSPPARLSNIIPAHFSRSYGGARPLASCSNGKNEDVAEIGVAWPKSMSLPHFPLGPPAAATRPVQSDPPVGRKTAGEKPGRSADRPTIPIAPPARPGRSAPTAGRIAGTVSREGGIRPSVARSRYGFGRPGSDGTGAVGPPGCNADRGGREETEPGRFPPQRTAQSSRPEPAT
jgi:hypothetical protein